MARIYYIIGKSASGKDSILKGLLQDRQLGLREIIQYTTRPIRDGETEGLEYHFVTPSEVESFRKEGRIIELREYQTVHGPWQYMMVDDGTIDLDSGDYAAVGTVESYRKVRDYFGADRVVPFYIDLDPGERLQRALDRERQHLRPKYAEMCRRFLADEVDFAPEKLEEAGLMKDGVIRNRFENVSSKETVKTLRKMILTARKEVCPGDMPAFTEQDRD